MGFLISYEERSVKAKGLNKLAKPNSKKIQEYLFPDELENLSLLMKIPKLQLPDNPILFYPGSGADILMPLKYIEILFPHLQKITFIFNDLDNNFGLIKTILDEVGISFIEKKDFLQFYWESILVDLQFIRGNVFLILHNISGFEIYFERAFRIMKDDYPEYENQIYQKLNQKGILISDSGFQHLPLEKVKISPELSAYKEMIIGVKN